jgi:hypothetical protein
MTTKIRMHAQRLGAFAGASAIKLTARYLGCCEALSPFAGAIPDPQR